MQNYNHDIVLKDNELIISGKFNFDCAKNVLKIIKNNKVNSIDISNIAYIDSSGLGIISLANEKNIIIKNPKNFAIDNILNSFMQLAMKKSNPQKVDC